MEHLFLGSEHHGTELFPEGVEVRAGEVEGLAAGGCGLFLGAWAESALEEVQFRFPPESGRAEFGAGAGGGWVEVWEGEGEGDCEVDVARAGGLEGERGWVGGDEGDLGGHDRGVG